MDTIDFTLLHIYINMTSCVYLLVTCKLKTNIKNAENPIHFVNYIFFSCDSESDINNLKHWTYKIEYEIENNDSIKPFGRIEFRRTKSLEDKLREGIYNEPWFPSLAFDIYNISDMKSCEEISKKMIVLSSCLDAHLEGDLIINHNYIFYNNSGCLNCAGSENGIDFCRPIEGVN